jgi:hypothetical protein
MDSGMMLATPTNGSKDELSLFAEMLTDGNTELVQAIAKIHQALSAARVHLAVTEFVRWCNTSLVLSTIGTNPRQAAGIAALRTIIDCLTSTDRSRVTKHVLEPFIPPLLAFIVVVPDDPSKTSVFDCPIVKAEGGQIESQVTGIRLQVAPDASLDELKTAILWTRSAVDMADAVFTAIASGAITIFEGSPGRGKTACINCAEISRSLLHESQSITNNLG